MKKVLGILLIFSLVFTSIISCGQREDNKAKENKLKAYMLGGMYAIYSYGGTPGIKLLLQDVDLSERSQMISTYSIVFRLPFDQDEEIVIKELLSESWGISNREELLESLEKLKTQNDEKNPHKAWDFARAVNKASMGYAAKYITSEEADKYVTELLPLAKSSFNTWEDFMKDFLEGRILWNPNSKSDIKEFTEIIEDMFKDDSPTNIYQTLPLN